jgi:hypothetical protein
VSPDNDSTLKLVAHYFVCERRRPGDIKDLLLAKHGITIGLHDVYNKYIPEILEKDGWLRLVTPMDDPLAEQMKKLPYRLDEVRVASTTCVDDVATQAAEVIRDFITERARELPEVHIGFSGGNTTRKVFRKLVHLLNDPTYQFPEDRTLVCHALVAGFDNEHPGTDPSSFFSLLDDSPALFKRKFVLFHAPAIAPAKQLKAILDLPVIRKARESASDLHLIVTAAASFGDVHSQLRQYYETYDRPAFKKLERTCVGDVLWLPVDDKGPMDLSQFESRPVTLLELQHLPDRIARGRKVLLVLGPCADPAHPCEESKAGILKAILAPQIGTDEASIRRHITHLIVDNKTAGEFLRSASTAAKDVA